MEDRTDERQLASRTDTWKDMKAQARSLGRPFTWFMGAISLINLFDNIDIIRLRSQFLGWIESYRHLVEKVGGFLFGWIDFWGLAITTTELHALAFGWIFLGPSMKLTWPGASHAPLQASWSPKRFPRPNSVVVGMALVTSILIMGDIVDTPFLRLIVFTYAVSLLAISLVANHVARNETYRDPGAYGPPPSDYVIRLLGVGSVAGALVVLDRILLQLSS